MWIKETGQEGATQRERKCDIEMGTRGSSLERCRQPETALAQGRESG